MQKKRGRYYLRRTQKRVPTPRVGRLGTPFVRYVFRRHKVSLSLSLFVLTDTNTTTTTKKTTTTTTTTTSQKKDDDVNDDVCDDASRTGGGGGGATKMMHHNHF